MYNDILKKQRGQTRKLKRLLRNIDAFRPFENCNGEYEHFHVPSGMFIEHNNTRGKIKTEFCKKWISITESFIQNKPKNFSFCKIIGIICVPDLWNSQIIIFYDEDYYNNFWNRKSSEQEWKFTGYENDFFKQRNIETSMCQKWYHETIKSDFDYECDLCFLGELTEE